MSAGIAYKITCTIDNKETTILLDTINETSVNTSSNLTQHPIVNGDMVADHMYKDPITISLSGSFSLNGGTLMNISSTGSSLSNIQTLFERIKNEGIVCSLMKVMTDSKQNMRFLERNNMVLTSIRWSEKVNSMDFSFTFTQVLTQTGAILSQNSINLTTDDTNQTVPSIYQGSPEGTAPTQIQDETVPVVNQSANSSVSTTREAEVYLEKASVGMTSAALTDTDILNLMKFIISKMCKDGYVSKDFITMMCSYSQATIYEYAKAYTSNASEKAGIYNSIHSGNFSYKLIARSGKNNEVFSKSLFNSSKNDQNAKRFIKYIYNTYKTCQTYFAYVKIFATNKTGAQQFDITIDSSQLTFRLEYNNVSGTYNLKMYRVINGEKSLLKTVSNVGGTNNYWNFLTDSVNPFYSLPNPIKFLYFRYYKDFYRGAQVIVSSGSLSTIKTQIENNFTNIINSF